MKITVFSVLGLDCPAEEKLIRNKFKNISGITNLEFNFIRQELMVTHDLSDVQIILSAIKDIGMEASVKNSGASKQIKKKPTFAYKSWGLVAIAGLMALGAEVYAYFSQNEKSILVIFLSIGAIILVGKPTFKKGWLALRSFTLNINFLMMIAITGAAIIGEWPEAAMVTVLFALAELIERYSLDKARHAIEGLMEIAPNEALVKNGNEWKLTPVIEITQGDIIKVKPGERIPIDGILMSGNSSINQAPITGESIPVEKNIDDIVYAGTINEHGSFEFKVTTSVNNTMLAKIIHSVEEAQAVKAPTQRFVDQFSKYYTPLMVITAICIAIIPSLFFGQPLSIWLPKALVLLVIACPCALVISTPVTVVSGLAAGARQGLLIKGSTYLENGHKLRVIALDKTGTITQGKPLVTNIISLNGVKEETILKIAASLDILSEHPVAHAIVTHYQQKYSGDILEIKQFSAIPGHGVVGYIDNKIYYVGNHRLAEKNKVCSKEIELQLEHLEQEGKTTVIISTDQQVIGIIAVADAIKNTSAQAIKELHQLGIKTVMITGDNSLTANSIANLVGIDEVYANMLPENKLATIDKLIDQYQFVGMVGDGINDAPALAKANIGFAMGSEGTDIALETADVALMENSLIKLPTFIKISRKTSNILIQNISFAIIVKIIFFALAIFGKATLWMAVFADMGASLVVVFNGLRLLKSR
ncbi:MAG: heavy metal translocating P-type ATPase [Burkholderiales bacterium]|nr:heavy metal translocating P-type ATPase [Burkholderiales bacterium]